ncbi:MAG: hypothetical protein AB2705_22260 [Candidatus Thiodiazotropha sp.]
MKQQFEISKVRNHLYNCLKNNVLEPFPTQISQQLSTSPNYSLLNKYFDDQQKFQNLHFQKMAQNQTEVNTEIQPEKAERTRRYNIVSEKLCLQRAKAKQRMHNLRQQKSSEQKMAERQRNKIRISDKKNKV